MFVWKCTRHALISDCKAQIVTRNRDAHQKSEIDHKLNSQKWILDNKSNIQKWIVGNPWVELSRGEVRYEAGRGCKSGVPLGRGKSEVGLTE